MRFPDPPPLAHNWGPAGSNCTRSITFIPSRSHLSPMYRTTFNLSTSGEGDIVDITSQVREAIRAAGAEEAMVNVFVAGSTAAVTTIEYEQGVLSDLRKALSAVAPDDIPYAHDSRWGDGNGRSHVKASLVGPSLSIPVAGGEPMLGTWQQVVLLELDVRKNRSRTVVVTVTT